MKTLPLIFATLALSATIAVAETNPRWIRQNSISPDGQKIAFVYQGDIFIVSSEGGQAMQLTTNEAHDTEPILESGRQIYCIRLLSRRQQGHLGNAFQRRHPIPAERLWRTRNTFHNISPRQTLFRGEHSGRSKEQRFPR